MFQFKNFVVCIVLCLTLSSIDCVRGPLDTKLVKNECLVCICFATSGCINSERYGAGGMQGPLRITQPYWLDAGQPVLDGETTNSPGAFENCANNILCTKKMVDGYMARYARDCNGDGTINCDDYAAIHKLGPLACGLTLPNDYKRNYLKCKSIQENEDRNFKF